MEPVSRLRIAAVGEILWDLFDSGRYLGGAPFNFTVHAARLEHQALLVSAVGDDDLGRTALERMRQLCVDSAFVSKSADLPTGTVTVAVDAYGQPEYQIHHPAAYDRIEVGPVEQQALSKLNLDWIYFGTLQCHSDLNGPAASLARVLEAAPGALRFYDINLRPHSYTDSIVVHLLGLADVVKLNVDEVEVLRGMAGFPSGSIEAFCRQCAERYSLRAICVTSGEAGCAVLIAGQFGEVPAFRVNVSDTVGAGDAFAAAFLHGLTRAWPLEQIGEFANRVGALVASRPGGTPDWNIDEALSL